MFDNKNVSISTINTTNETIDNTHVNDLIWLQPAPDAVIAKGIPFGTVDIDR